MKKAIFVAIYLLLQITFLFAVAPDSNNTFYFKPDGTGENCSSWADACNINKMPDVVDYIKNHERQEFNIFMKAGDYGTYPVRGNNNPPINFRKFEGIINFYGGLKGDEIPPLGYAPGESPYGKSKITFNCSGGWYMIYLWDDYRNSYTSYIRIYNLELISNGNGSGIGVSGYAKGLIAWSILKFQGYINVSDDTILYRNYIESSTTGQVISEGGYIVNSIINPTSSSGYCMYDARAYVINSICTKDFRGMDSDERESHLIATYENISLNSEIIDPENGNFHLKPDSSLIDKGIDVTPEFLDSLNRDDHPELPEEYSVLTSKEPSPNGGLVNIGIYGGTDQATTSAQAVVCPDENGIFYMTPDGTGNCSSWENACNINKMPEIIKIANIAIKSGKQFKLFMKAGEYDYSNIGSWGFERKGKDTFGLVIYGGMKGDETEPIVTESPYGKSKIFFSKTDAELPYYTGTVYVVIRNVTFYNLDIEFTKTEDKSIKFLENVKAYWSYLIDTENTSSGVMNSFLYRCYLKTGTLLTENIRTYIPATAINSILHSDSNNFNLYGVRKYNCIIITSKNYNKAITNFVDFEHRNFHLKSDSTYLDKGVEVTHETVSYLASDGSQDVLVSNEPEPNGGAVNLGIYGGTSLATPTYTFQINSMNCDVGDNISVGEQFNCTANIHFFSNANNHTFTYKWILSKDDNETVLSGTISYDGTENVEIPVNNIFFKNKHVGNAKIYFVMYDNAYPSGIETKSKNVIVSNPVPIENANLICNPIFVLYPNQTRTVCHVDIGDYPYGEVVYQWKINNTIVENNNSSYLTVTFSEQNQTKNIKIHVYPEGFESLGKDNSTTVVSVQSPIIKNFSCNPTKVDAQDNITCIIQAENPNSIGELSYSLLLNGSLITTSDNNTLNIKINRIGNFTLKPKVCLNIENSGSLCKTGEDNISITVEPPVPQINRFYCTPAPLVKYPYYSKTTCYVNLNSYPYGDLIYEWYVNGELVDTTENIGKNEFTSSSDFTEDELKEIKVKIHPKNYDNKTAETKIINVLFTTTGIVPIYIKFDQNINSNGGVIPYKLSFDIFLKRRIYKYILNKIDILLAKDNENFQVIHTIDNFDNITNLHFEKILNETGNYKLKLISYSISNDNNTFETNIFNFKVINTPPTINSDIKIYKYSPNKIGILFEGIRDIYKKDLIKELNEGIIPDTAKYIITFDNETIILTPSRLSNPFVLLQNDKISNKTLNIDFIVKTTLNRDIKGHITVDNHFNNEINVEPDIYKKENLLMITASCIKRRGSVCYANFISQRFLIEKIQELNWRIYKIDNSGNETLQKESSGMLIKTILPDDGTYKVELTGKTTLNRVIKGEKIININWKRNAPVKAEIMVYPVKVINEKIKVIKPKYVYPLVPYDVYLNIKFYPLYKKLLKGWVFEYSTDNSSWQQIGGSFDNFVYGMVYKINHIGKNYFRVRTKNIFSGKEYISEPVVFETVAIPENIEDAKLPIRFSSKISTKGCLLKFYLDKNDIENFTYKYLDYQHNESLILNYANWNLKLDNQIISEGKKISLYLTNQQIDNLTKSYIISVQIPTTLKRIVNAKLKLTPDDLKELISSNAFIKDKIEEKFKFKNPEINFDNVSIFYIQNPFNPLFVRYIINIDGVIMSVLKEKGYQVEIDCGDATIVHNLLNFTHEYKNLGNYTVVVKILNSNNEIIKTISKEITITEISQYIQNLLNNGLIQIQKKYFNKIYKTLGLMVKTSPEIAYYLFTKTKLKIFVNDNYVKNLRLITLPITYDKNTVDVNLKIYDRKGRVLLAEKTYQINIENDFYTENNILKLVKLDKFIALSDNYDSEITKKRLWGYFIYKWHYDFNDILGYMPKNWYSYINFIKKKLQLKVNFQIRELNSNEIVYSSSRNFKVIKITKDGIYQPELHITYNLNGETHELTKTGNSYQLKNQSGNIYILKLELNKLSKYKDPTGKYLKMDVDIIYEDPDTLLQTVNYYVCGNKIKYHYLKFSKIIPVAKELIGNIPDECNVKIEAIDKFGKVTSKEVAVAINNSQ